MPNRTMQETKTRYEKERDLLESKMEEELNSTGRINMTYIKELRKELNTINNMLATISLSLTILR